MQILSKDQRAAQVIDVARRWVTWIGWTDFDKYIEASCELRDKLDKLCRKANDTPAKRQATAEAIRAAVNDHFTPRAPRAAASIELLRALAIWDVTIFQGAH